MNTHLSIHNAPDMDSDLLVQHIDAALSAMMIHKSFRSKMGEGSIKFSDLVQPANSGFSQILEGCISDGSKKLFLNQKSFSFSTWAADARTVAVDVLRGVGDIHWSAVGLLAVAIVLERLDKISSNDKECVDLLRGMSDLGKCIKQLQEIKAHLHKEIREKMSEAVYLIITGAMMCCSVIRSKKLSKFMLSTKIREELISLRGQVDRMFRDLMFQVQLKTLSSFISYTSLQAAPETPAGEIVLQSDQAVAETSCEGQIHRNALSFNSQQTTNHQHFDWNHGCSSTIGSHKTAYHYRRKGIISHILRGIRGDRKTAGDEKYERLVMKQGMKDLDRGAALFPYHEIQIACQHFHPDNKLGEGGFGSVYKGTLEDGRQLAIKRLSSQGKSLFMNEWDITSRLQHRNIVKLFGCCVEGEETLLIYEYMPKGNLHEFLFNPLRVHVLDWGIQLNIMRGVARGLTYLHEDCWVRVVHRDIKLSNILLDENLNAKITDFGLGALTENDSNQNIPVAGTEGYIAPECKSGGNVTDKADVFSFGVVILEMLSFRSCMEFNPSFPGLVKWAWDLHDKNRHIDLVDSRLICSKAFDCKIMMRVILIALLCTQEARLRPSMSKVSLILSLSSEEEIGMAIPTKPDYLYNS